MEHDYDTDLAIANANVGQIVFFNILVGFQYGRTFLIYLKKITPEMFYFLFSNIIVGFQYQCTFLILI